MKAQAQPSGKTTLFIVQAFGETQFGAIDMEQPLPARSKEAALALGRQLAESKPGVVFLSREMDYALGEYGDLVVLASHGEVPVDVTAFSDD